MTRVTLYRHTWPHCVRYSGWIEVDGTQNTININFSSSLSFVCLLCRAVHCLLQTVVGWCLHVVSPCVCACVGRRGWMLSQKSHVCDKEIFLVGLLEGRTLDQRMKEGGRMFVVNFIPVFKEFAAKINSQYKGDRQGFQYYGLCLLYRRCVTTPVRLTAIGVTVTAGFNVR
jgi:hypothetical protein